MIRLHAALAISSWLLWGCGRSELEESDERARAAAAIPDCTPGSPTIIYPIDPEVMYPKGNFISDGTKLYVISREMDDEAATSIVGIAKDTREVATVTTLKNQSGLTLYGGSLLTFSYQGFVLTPTTGGAGSTFPLDKDFGVDFAVDPPRIAALSRDGIKSRKLMILDEIGAQPREFPLMWTKEKPRQFVIAGEYAYLLRDELRRVSLATGLEEAWVEGTADWQHLVGASDGGLYFAVSGQHSHQSWIQHLPRDSTTPSTVLTVSGPVSQILPVGTELYVRTGDGALRANTSTGDSEWFFQEYRGEAGLFADDHCIFLEWKFNIVREPR